MANTKDKYIQGRVYNPNTGEYETGMIENPDYDPFAFTEKQAPAVAPTPASVPAKDYAAGLPSTDVVIGQESSKLLGTPIPTTPEMEAGADIWGGTKSADSSAQLGTGEVPIYDPGTTELEKSLQDVLYGQMSGDIPKLTGQMVEEQKDILRPTYATMSEEEKASTAEKFRTAGRLRGSRQMYEQEKLKSQQEGRLTTAAIAQANTELGRIDAAVGRGLAAGLTFSEMETKKEMLTSEQKYGLGMYQVKVKDQAKMYFTDQKFKEHWANLERAWAEEDWDKYAELSKELAAAQMPDLTDYLLSFVPSIITAFA